MNDHDKMPVTDRRFLGLITSLSAATLQQMGKVAHPATGQIETDLEAAQYSIDLLEVIERKTRGNLSDEERKTLRQSLTMLRLSYVETARAAKKPAAESDRTSEPASPASDADKKTDE
jgi:hypothetical protein